MPRRSRVGSGLLVTSIVTWLVPACARTAGVVPASGAASPPVAPGTAASACVADFDSTYAIVTRDYAGYQDRMRESASRIAAVADSVRAAARTVGSDSLCTATIQRWTRIFNEHDHHLQFWQVRPEPTPAAGGASTSEDRRRPTLRFADDSTAVITLPTFDRRYRPAIDSLVAAHRARLLATPYLVVDIRRNGGGATASYRSVMALVYTDPIRREGFDVWVSAGTVAAVRPMLGDTAIDAAARAEMRVAVERFDSTGKPFLLEGKDGEARYDTVYAMPRVVAVLTGRGCASSCEQFVLDAMYSRKVTVFGTENTAGFLDYGNVRYVTLPSGIRRLGVPSTRSRRLPTRPMDKTGIAPHVLIPKDEPDPIGFAVRHIKSAPAASRRSETGS